MADVEVFDDVTMEELIGNALKDPSYPNLLEAVNGQIFLMKMPDNIDKTLPAISYVLPSATPLPVLVGASGFSYQRLTVDVWAKTAIQAARIAKSVKKKLDGYQQLVTTDDCTYVGQIQAILWQDTIPIYQDDTEIWHWSLDFLVQAQDS